MLARSKMAPLIVVADVSTNNARRIELLQATLTRIAQIQKLSLNQIQHFDLNKNLSEEILANLVDPAPLLESFSVAININIDANMLPQNLFSGEAPRLRELDLRRCGLAWDTPILHGLTSFKLVSIPLAAKPSIVQFITALSNMPNLETLELCDALHYQVSSVKTYPGLIVSLPHLTRLSIKSEAPEGDFLLNHLVFPPTASVTIICMVGRESANVSYILPSISGFRKILGQLYSVRCLSVCYFRYPDASFQLSTYDAPGTCLTSPRNAHVDLMLRFGAQPLQPTLDKCWKETFQSLWTSIPLKELESLHVKQCPESQDWSHIFNSLAATKLKRLRVTGDSWVAFLQAFSPKGQILLEIPSLRELTIEGWTFDDMAGRTCAELLKKCLKDRRERQNGIHELFLVDCRHITGYGVEKLGKYVKNMTWDGEENFTDTENLEGDVACPCSSCAGGYNDGY
jgi:hypothetical protein